jgi:hypothetical protein
MVKKLIILRIVVSHACLVMQVDDPAHTIDLPVLYSLALYHQSGIIHSDKTRVQMTAKMFPHLKLIC